MKVGIHKARYGKFSEYLQRYETILKHNNIQCTYLDVNSEHFWDEITNIDLFIYRWRHFHDEKQIADTILPIIERAMSIKCFPNMATCWHYDDKIKQYYLLRQLDFPTIKSWVFWSKAAAYYWIENVAQFPVVFKLKGGAASSNVILLKSKSEAKRIVKIMFSKGVKSGRLPTSASTRWKDFNIGKEIHRWGGNILRILRDEDIYPYWQVDKNYAYFQEFLPNNDYDTRVTIIGDRAFAYRRMNRENDFRSSGSGVLSYDTTEIDMRFIETAFAISKSLGFQSMAYDFLKDQHDNVKFCEISYDFIDTYIFKCPGHWDSKLNWHKGNYWPQFCHLSDALELPDLEQPKIECSISSNIKIV